MAAKMAEVRRKRTFADAFQLVVWDRGDISACNCSEKSYRHVHCPCKECGGKATSRKVELEHWKRSQLLHLSSNSSRENSSFRESNMETDSVGSTEDINEIFHCSDEELRDEDFISPEAENSGINSSENEDENIYTPNGLEKTVVKAVLKAFQLTENTKSSHHNFEDILNFGKELFCEGLGEECDMDIVNSVWPSSWEEAQTVLRKEGYENPKEYFVCFCRKKARGRKSSGKKHVYNGKWDIMEDKKQTCKHCGRKGKIKYYYLGLENKVKLWCGDLETCQKTMAHWQEKDHWLVTEDQHSEDNERNVLYNEIWDGDRFSELSWFWNPDADWILPARCPESWCSGIVSSGDIEAAPVGERTEEKVLECPNCYTEFTYKVKHAKGDPRNLAYIGHWDGWSPYKSGNHKCGAIEVSVATMRKQERCSVNEVYVIGFVPSNLVPTDNPNSLDPFLQPLVKEIKDGFIDGYEVEHKGGLPGFQSEKVLIRHLLLCWTGDYPALCEVGKFLNGGVSPCRRCKLKGVGLPNANHYQKYYGNCRYHAKYPWEQRVLESEVFIMEEIQHEARKTARKKMSSQHGYTGVSILHELNPLYGFDVIRDLVYDIHHNLPLNVIKNQIDRLIETGILNAKQVEQRLDKIPWTNEFTSGRQPVGFDTRRGHWKAEEYKKFAFPGSEAVLDGLLPEREFEIWTNIARLTEMHFYSGRFGWSQEDICNSYKLSARFNILVEEVQGLEMCVVTNHNLLHIPEDIKRFSSTDNYWCFPFERAVKKYTSRTSNCKHIEVTFAKAEARREFLKVNPFIEAEGADQPVYADLDRIMVNSERDARKLAKEEVDPSRGDRLNSGILIGSCKNMKVEELSQAEVEDIADCCTVSSEHVSRIAIVTARAFLPKLGHEGVVVKPEESLICDDPGLGEKVVIVEKFLSVMANNQYNSFLKGQVCNDVKEGGELQIKDWSGFSLVQKPTANIFLKLDEIKRKVMLYPNNDKETFVVLDYSRPSALYYVPVVPCFPELGDVVQILGEGEEWFGQVKSVNVRNKTAQVQPLTASARWPGRNLYLRDKRIRMSSENVHWNSILQVANGRWCSGSCWEWIP